MLVTMFNYSTMSAMANEIYFNTPQQVVMYTQAHTSVIVAGRRTGKTHGVRAPWLLRNVQTMPRSTGAIVVPTYKKGLLNTLPGVFNALSSFGFIRDVHYVVGRRPPKSLGFAKPIIEPASFEHVISWYNGSINILISQDVEGSSNSLTLDYIDIDEARFVDFAKLKDETFPANGGIKSHFGHIPYHHGMLIVSDMPTSKRGSWFLNYKELADEDVITTIHGIIYELWRIRERIRSLQSSKQEVPSYLYSKIRSLNKSLCQLRRVAILYREWSTIENLLLVGESYIAQMKRDLPPLIFLTSILCKRIGTIKENFYSALLPKIHYYRRNNNDYLQGLEFDFAKAAKGTSLQDGDIDPAQPLCIAADYNANINWLVVGQYEGRYINVVNSFYVKYERKLRELIKDFCEYYKHHLTRTIVYYYDSTAKGNNYATNADDFCTTIQRALNEEGWNVIMVDLGSPLAHREKHMLINGWLKGQEGFVPRLNEENNEELIFALETAGVRVGIHGFQKDKSGEKLAETEEDKLEYRTDGTDAFDTLVIGMNKRRYYTSSIVGSLNI